MDFSIIEEAYNEVEFYKKKWELNLEEKGKSPIQITDLPLLKKDEIVGNSLQLVSPRYILGLYKDEYLCANTSGSTGKCLEIYWKRSDYMRSMYSLWFYRRKFYGVNTWDKKCQFFTLSQVGGKEPKSIKRSNNLDFSKCDLNEERLVEIYNEMLEFQPDWLLLQPCIAELLCIVKRKFRLSKIQSLKYIELTGEWLADSLKQQINEEFQCPIANQYGANEVNSLAYECPEGNLHCMEDNVFLEVLDDNEVPVSLGEEGDIYVTTLHNHVMPFIRYKIGDRGALYANTCTCGHRGKILHLHTGRANDWVFQRDGNKITPYVFVRAIDAVNVVFDNCILQYQITQIDFESFDINFVVDEYSKDICQFFIQNIGHEKLKYSAYNFHFYKQLLPEQNGKRSFFKNEMVI